MARGEEEGGPTSKMSNPLISEEPLDLSRENSAESISAADNMSKPIALPDTDYGAVEDTELRGFAHPEPTFYRSTHFSLNRSSSEQRPLDILVQAKNSPEFGLENSDVKR